MISKTTIVMRDSASPTGMSETQTGVKYIQGSLALVDSLKADRRFGKYNITHLPTGWAVRWFKTQKAALNAIREWNKLYNWDFTEPRCSSVLTIGKTIKQTPEWVTGTR